MVPVTSAVAPSKLPTLFLCPIPQIVNGVPERKQKSRRLPSKDRATGHGSRSAKACSFSPKTNGLTESLKLEVSKECPASPPRRPAFKTRPVIRTAPPKNKLRSAALAES